MKKKVYLLILSQHLGGAEIRFLRIFKELAKLSNSIYLLFCDGYLKKVTAFKEFEDYASYLDKIIELNKTYSYYKNASFNLLYQDVIQLVPKDSLIHFNQNFPASFPKLIRHKTVYTYNENSIKRFSLKDQIFFYLILFRANAIDILDPIIYKSLKRQLFLKKNIKLTKAGSLNIEDYNFNFDLKENSILFSGRFNEQKQVMKFVDSIKIINNVLENANLTKVKFYVIGDGPLIKEVEAKVQKLSEEGISIFSGFMKDYKELLNESKVFLSIQKYNNYPSNSLMEAMACGNIPITIDNGSTKLLAKPSFSYYLEENFTAEQLATAIKSALILGNNEAKKKAMEASQTIMEEYNVQVAAKYYFTMYKEVCN